MKRTTKISLVLSVFMMILSVTMLVSTTFAWFTDSASTGVNKIQAGNLSLKVEHSSDFLTWEELDNATPIFDNSAQFEPGYVAVRYLKVSNEGTLALKFQIIVEVIKEVEGLTEQGEAIVLSNILKYDVVEADAKLQTRQDAIAAATNATNFVNKTSFKDEVLEPTDVKTYAIIIYMDEAVGNEANFRQVMPSIEFGIRVDATQAVLEEDSYGSTYDENALLPVYASSVNTLKSAALKGGLVVFTNDIDLTGSGGSEQVTFLKNSTIDLSTSTLNGTLETGSYLSSGPTTSVTIKGDASLAGYNVDATYRKESGAMMQFTAISVLKPTTIIESGKYTCNNSVINNQVQGVYDEAGVIVKGGTFDATDAGVCLANIIGKAIIDGGTFNVAGDGAIVHAASGDSKQETVTTINGGTFNATDAGAYAFYFAHKNAKVIVNGGTFNVNALFDGNTNAVLIINGGTFNVDPTLYVDLTTHKVVTNPDSTFTVTLK